MSKFCTFRDGGIEQALRRLGHAVIPIEKKYKGTGDLRRVDYFEF